MTETAVIHPAAPQDEFRVTRQARLTSRLRTRLALSGEAAPQPGGFEILAISAGEGNGWLFSAEVLKASLALWEKVETFIDHPAVSAHSGRSLRDLAGICMRPRWDDAHQGIRLSLRPLGPAADVLRGLGELLLEDAETRPDVGFSADLLFSASGKTVKKILKVYSVDLVFDPARGGAFLAALQRSPQPIEPPKEKRTMTQPYTAALCDCPEEDPGQPAAIAGELRGYLLETALQAAQLPGSAADHLRSRFAEREFSPEELRDAIAESRRLVAELTAPAQVHGLSRDLGRDLGNGSGRIHSQFTSEDRLQAAVDDLFGAPRAAHLQNAQPARLGGIRELYLMLTGDDDLHGGIYPERVRFAATADFTGLVKNAMNKVVAQTWEELGRAGYDWWQRVTRVEHFNTLHTITGILVGTVGSLPSVAEGGAYTELAVGDSPETASFTKYGGYIPLTLELIDRDETHKLRAYPRELAAAGLRKISSLVAGVFTANSGAGPTLADTGALFNSTAVTTAGGHANLGTAALSAESWEAACQAVFKQPMLVKNAATFYGTGSQQAVNPRYLLVPRALQLTGMQIVYPNFERSANIYSENQQRGEPGDVVTVPEWSDANNWAAVCDPRIAPAVYIGERFGLMPEIFLSGSENYGAVFTNDQHRLKVRHFLSVWVNDFRPLYKANVADA